MDGMDGLTALGGGGLRFSLVERMEEVEFVLD